MITGNLPRTGSAAWLPISFGVSLLVCGVLLLRRRRRGEVSAA
jgi:LPXTG-motif cell wall-anchored protein